MAIDDRSDADQPAALPTVRPPADRSPIDPPDPDPESVATLARAAVELGRLTDQEPSPGLVPAVMHSVWAELRPGQLIPLPGSAGRLLVGSSAIATAITGRLDDLVDLVVRRCTVEPPDPESADPAAASVRVELTAAVAYGSDTRDLAAQVRSVVTRTVTELFGLDVDQVDLAIDDVFARGSGR